MIPMTIAETCEILRVSRWTLGRLIKAGEIAAAKREPAVRNSPVDIDASSVSACIRRHTIPAPHPTENSLMDSDAPGRLLFLEEVAEETGLPLRTLKLGCRRGEIRHVRFGKKPQMSRAHIAELIEKYTVGGADADQDADIDPDEAVNAARVARMAATAGSGSPARAGRVA